MIRQTLSAVLACVVTFALCAVAYPAAVYLISMALFPHQARGSLIERDGRVIGSALIAQPFASDKYFAPRPSAAGYAADAASGSNLATTNPALRDQIALDSARQIAGRTGDLALKRELGRLDAADAELKAKAAIPEPSEADRDAIARLEAEMGSARGDALARAGELGRAAYDMVPADLVTTSGSGLDPHISPEAARYQAGRVAAARGVPIGRIATFLDERVDRSGEFLGAPPRLNVLLLNLALDEEFPAPGPTPAASPAPSQTRKAPALPEGEAARAGRIEGDHGLRARPSGPEAKSTDSDVSTAASS